jgi:nicotinamidase-related amidase
MFNPARSYEPLTSDNAALVLIDHQVGLMTGVRDYSIAELKHNVLGLAKAASALKLPIVVTTTARDSMWGPTFPELIEALPGVPIIDRSTVNAFDDPRVARAIEATGRKKLIFAGLSLEVCAAFPAMTAVGKGFDPYVAVDACGTFSETKHQVGLLRMMQAGVILSDYATLMIEVHNAREPLIPSATDRMALLQLCDHTAWTPARAACSAASLVWSSEVFSTVPPSPLRQGIDPQGPAHW